MYFEFTKDCEIGIPQIDAEHKYLFSLMNQLMEVLHGDAAPETGGKTLESYVEMLIDYGRTHFAHEEAYLEETDDVELSLQKRDHAGFLRRMEALDLTDLSNEEKRRMLEDTLSYLTKWLYNHILSSDTLIGKVEHIAEHVMDSDDFLQFTQKYWIGVEVIDNEHRRLFELIGEAYRLVESGGAADRYDEIMHLLDELEDYTATHFSHEEAIMENIRYPYLDAQRRAHGMFLDRLADKDFGESNDNQQKYLEDLLDFLFSWLGNHILKMDRLIAKYIPEGLF